MYYNRFRQEINSFCVVQRLERQLAGELEQRVGQYLRHGQTGVFGHALIKAQRGRVEDNGDRGLGKTPSIQYPILCQGD